MDRGDGERGDPEGLLPWAREGEKASYIQSCTGQVCGEAVFPIRGQHDAKGFVVILERPVRIPLSLHHLPHAPPIYSVRTGPSQQVHNQRLRPLRNRWLPSRSIGRSRSVTKVGNRRASLTLQKSEPVLSPDRAKAGLWVKACSTGPCQGRTVG